MADTPRDQADETQPSPNGSKNEIEREDIPPRPKSDAGNATRGLGGQTGPTDPDSAKSDVDRDDSEP